MWQGLKKIFDILLGSCHTGYSKSDIRNKKMTTKDNRIASVNSPLKKKRHKMTGRIRKGFKSSLPKIVEVISDSDEGEESSEFEVALVYEYRGVKYIAISSSLLATWDKDKEEFKEVRIPRRVCMPRRNCEFGDLRRDWGGVSVSVIDSYVRGKFTPDVKQRVHSSRPNQGSEDMFFDLIRKYRVSLPT